MLDTKGTVPMTGRNQQVHALIDSNTSTNGAVTGLHSINTLDAQHTFSTLVSL